MFPNHYGNFLSVAACSFTAPMQKSEVALRFLRKEPPYPEDLLTPTQIERNENGRILGVVRRSDGLYCMTLSSTYGTILILHAIPSQRLINSVAGN